MIGTLVTPTTTSIRRPLVLDVYCVHLACVYSACVLFVRWKKKGVKKKKGVVPFANYQKPILDLFAIVVPCCGCKPAKENLSKIFSLSSKPSPVKI